ncbi:MAG: RHS repeat-associated core domain-containing protein [Halothece sp.]
MKRVTNTSLYDAYGNLLNSTGTTVNPYRYAGEQYDPVLEHYYLRARYYDPSTGRFTSRDPFEGVQRQPLSLAKYPYAHGNPVNLTDPSGLFVGYGNPKSVVPPFNSPL